MISFFENNLEKYKLCDIYKEKSNMTDKEFMRAELQGRLKVIYELQTKEPDSIVISMPLKHPYDLEWMHRLGGTEKIEVKNRNIRTDEHKTAMFNVEKVDRNGKFGSDFIYVATYTDNKSIWFHPTEMPESAITYDEKWISTVTIDPDSEKKLQTRVFYNINDGEIHNIPRIVIDDDE